MGRIEKEPALQSKATACGRTYLRRRHGGCCQHGRPGDDDDSIASQSEMANEIVAAKTGQSLNERGPARELLVKDLASGSLAPAEISRKVDVLKIVGGVHAGDPGEERGLLGEVHHVQTRSLDCAV